MHWTLLPLLVTAVSAAAIEETGEEMVERDGKLFSIFQIVRFDNEQCKTDDGRDGICFTAAECREPSRNGEAIGTCASGFGVCCHINLNDQCNSGQVIAQPVVSITEAMAENGIANADPNANCIQRKRSEGRQLEDPAYFSKFIIGKYSPDVVQFKITFKTAELSGPMDGDCKNDTITITGADPASTRNIPTLCGVLSGQHIYVNVKTVDTFVFTISLSSLGLQKWDISVTAIESNSEILAPRGCLQYHTEAFDSIETFNNDDGNGELLNNQLYSICIKQDDEYCDVSLNQNNFDLGKSKDNTCDDAVSFGYQSFCGDALGISQWNYTGPYVIPVMTDSMNDNKNFGFKINYVLLPCPT